MVEKLSNYDNIHTPHSNEEPYVKREPALEIRNAHHWGPGLQSNILVFPLSTVMSLTWLHPQINTSPFSHYHGKSVSSPHLSRANVSQVNKIHWFPDHGSVNPSSPLLRLRLLYHAAAQFVPKFTHIP